jgi:hypothetical protein
MKSSQMVPPSGGTLTVNLGTGSPRESTRLIIAAFFA